MSKVFISYSHDSDYHRQRVLDLSDRLNKNDIDCDIDQYVNGSPDEGWPLWMERKLNEADFVLVVCTEIYLDRVQRKEKPGVGKGVKWESLLAYQDIYENDSLNRKYVPIIFNTTDTAFVPNPLKAVSHYDLGKDNDYEMLCRYITGQPLAVKPLSGQKLHLPPRNTPQNTHTTPTDSPPSVSSAQTTPPTAPKSSPQATYDPCNPAFLVPFRAKGKFMVGRDTALEKVRQQMLAGKPTSIGQTALFQGIGGLGKTQLAVEYADQYRDQYPNGIYWITADENIDSQLTQIAVAARWVAPESEHVIKLDIARHRLKTYSDCLIVYDNLESIDAIRDYLPAPSARPHILVTSRREQPDFIDVKLDLLDDEQSYLMLVQEAGTPPANNEEESAAREISSVLSGLPLALELAGAFLEHRPIGWCAYRDLLRVNLKQALPTQLASLTKHEADLFKTLSVSEQEISVEPLLAEVLDILTWSGSSPMSQKLMAYLLEVKETDLSRALGLGVALRLLQKAPNSERYAVHRLVQEVRRQNRPLTQCNEWAVRTAQRLGDWLEEIRKDFRELPVFELEFEHLSTWQAFAQKFSPDTSVRLLWLQAYPAYHRGHYDESYRILQLALSQYDVNKLDNIPLKANLLSDLAYILDCKGVINDSLKMAEDALQLRRDYFGDIHPDVSSSLQILANAYMASGDYPRALDLGMQALDMRRKLWGDRHPEVGNSLSSLAAFYAKLNNHPLALKLSMQALEMARELYGDKHPNFATALSSLASRYGKLEDYPSAIKLGEQSIKLRRELLGDKHPDIATSLNNLSTYHAGLRSSEKALEYGLQAIKMQRELLGEKHPSVANTLGNLAHFYERIGDHFHALDHGIEALSMKCELLGYNHPDTIESLQFVAIRLFRNPLTSARGKVLVEDYLKHITHDHSSREKVLNILNTPRNGFRTRGKISHGKKQKKNR